MRHLLRDFGLILGLAVLWAVSGYCIGLALEIIGFDTYRLSIILASINLILGMSLFLRVTKDPTADRLFFGRARPDDPVTPAIGCLWSLPLLLLILGVSMWFWAIILRLILPK